MLRLKAFQVFSNDINCAFKFMLKHAKTLIIWQNVHKIDRQIEMDPPPIRTAGGSRFGVPLFPHVCQILFVNDHVPVEPVKRFRRTRLQSGGSP